MRRSDSRAALTDEVARFQDEIRQLALTAARAVIEQELDRRLAKIATGPGRTAAKPTRGRRTAAVAGPPPAKPREASQPEVASEAGAPTSAPGALAPAGALGPTGGRKRIAWTRESIVDELAKWMLSGTSIDAAFVARHGPPGLVAATRRIFGRFDAALNVAGLHISKLYPDGPPDARAAPAGDKR